MAANPWEMNWQAEQAPSQQGGMPWQMNWKEDKKPIDFSIPTEEALRTSSVKEQPITRSYADEFKRQLGLTARYLTEGTVGTADFLATPVRKLQNAIMPENLQAKPLSQVLTRNLPQPETINFLSI